MKKLEWHHGAALAFLFFLGDFLLIGGVLTLSHTAWLSVLSAAVLSLPILYLYSRLLSVQTPPKLLVFLLLPAVLILGAISLSNFAHFITACVLSHTAKYLVPAALLLFALWLAWKEIGALTRFCHLTGPVVFAFLLLSLCATIAKIDPVYADSMLPADPSAFLFAELPVFFSLYCLQGFVLMTLFRMSGRPLPIFKATAVGLIISAVMVSAAFLSSLLALGPGVFSSLSYPVYYPPGLSGKAEYLERIEILLLGVFQLTELVKISTYLAYVKGCFSRR